MDVYGHFKHYSPLISTHLTHQLSTNILFKCPLCLICKLVCTIMLHLKATKARAVCTLLLYLHERDKHVNKTIKVSRRL